MITDQDLLLRSCGNLITILYRYSTGYSCSVVDTVTSSRYVFSIAVVTEQLRWEVRHETFRPNAPDRGVKWSPEPPERLWVGGATRVL